MTITVVICSYKYGHLAAHAIESVLSQTRKPDKILFVDDGVGDCKHLPAIYPEVEYVFREENLGTVKNFQDMLMRVTTDKVMFLGADNWLRSDALEVLSNYKEDIVIYDIQVTGELKGEILRRHPEELHDYQGDLYWNRRGSYHGSMMYSTELGKKVGYDSPAGRSLEDRFIYNGMIKLGATQMHVPIPFLYYRRHRENFNPC